VTMEREVLGSSGRVKDGLWGATKILTLRN
jgi:hypothetical protein